MAPLIGDVLLDSLQRRVNMTINDHEKHKTVDEMIHQR